jgi:hypothetical protein
MQAIQRWLPRLLVLGAIGVVVAALFSDHKNAYGEVPLPQGGVVDLPEGESKVYLDEIVLGEAASGGDPRRLSGLLAFTVQPVGGGAPLSIEPVGNGSSTELNERSQGIGSKDAVATVDAPAAGDYRVSGRYESTATASLSFGTDPFSAVMAEWRIWAGMLALAFLISLVPRAGYRPKDEVPDLSSSDPAEPAPPAYDPSSSYSPYRG